MRYYKFDCGCTWPIVGDAPREGALPFIEIDHENLPDCQRAWDLLGRGETRGVFQLESQLGKGWSKKLKPRSIEHMSALGAILRPGVLKAYDSEGVSMTEHYCRRANDQEPTEFFHESIKDALSSTYGVLIYQEQAMQIARSVSGFTLQEADELRKAIGKKLTEEMAKVKVKFIDGAKKVGAVTEDEAAQIFGWIEKSQRYAFNRSHSTCYGLTGYDTAYLKAHIPVWFFTSWLIYAKDKQDPMQEIADLVQDAKLYDINVEVPDLRSLEPHFWSDGVRVVFGLSDIKGIGVNQIGKLKATITESEQKLGKGLGDFSWFEFLVRVSSQITSSVVSRLILVGAMGWLKVSRKRMETEYGIWSKLTQKEQEWIIAQEEKMNADGKSFSSLSAAMLALGKTKKDGGGCANKNRVEYVNSQTLFLKGAMEDSPSFIAWAEEQFLGIPITFSKIDSCDTSEVNAWCKDYLNGQSGFLLFGVQLKQVREVKTKRGKNPGQKMAFFTIQDNTGVVEGVTCFPDVYHESASFITEDGMVLLQGERDPKTDGLIVKKIWPPE